jgi:hypothetical protein
MRHGESRLWNEEKRLSFQRHIASKLQVGITPLNLHRILVKAASPSTGADAVSSRQGCTACISSLPLPSGLLI